MNSFAPITAHPALASAALLTRIESVHDVRVVRAPEAPAGSAWWTAALVSWGIALFEYLLQVPANRIGYA